MAITELRPHVDHTRDDTSLRELEERVRDLDRRVENSRLVRDTWTLIIFAIAVFAVVASLVAVGFAIRAIDEAQHHAPAAVAALMP
jgi:hypothetical protein